MLMNISASRIIFRYTDNVNISVADLVLQQNRLRSELGHDKNSHHPRRCRVGGNRRSDPVHRIPDADCECICLPHGRSDHGYMHSSRGVTAVQFEDGRIRVRGDVGDARHSRAWRNFSGCTTLWPQRSGDPQSVTPE